MRVHRFPPSPIHPGDTVTFAACGRSPVRVESTNSVTPAAAPTIAKASPTLAAASADLPDEISPDLLAGQGPPAQAPLRSSYVERAIDPNMANVANPAAPTPAATYAPVRIQCAPCPESGAG